jgi:Carboxypeptidase regulatory-like domain
MSYLKSLAVRVFVSFVLLVFAFSLQLPAGRAQFESGTDLGTVHDPSGATVAGATVTLTNLRTNIAVHATTDGNGDFEL